MSEKPVTPAVTGLAGLAGLVELVDQRAIGWERERYLDECYERHRWDDEDDGDDDECECCPELDSEELAERVVERWLEGAAGIRDISLRAVGELIRELMVTRALLRRAAARLVTPAVTDRLCACGCGRPVTSARPEARYATGACRVRAHRERQP
jgi:hypothetical protein